MTKRQKMFDEIGMAFGRTMSRRSARERNFTFSGLCTACDFFTPLLPDGFKYKKFHKSPISAYWCPIVGSSKYDIYEQAHTRIHDLWRSDFAFLLSIMSDEDYNRIVGE